MQEKADGGWAPPGGWADPNDSPSNVAVREVSEEAHVTVRARACRAAGPQRARAPAPISLSYLQDIHPLRISGRHTHRQPRNARRRAVLDGRTAAPEQEPHSAAPACAHGRTCVTCAAAGP